MTPANTDIKLVEFGVVMGVAVKLIRKQRGITQADMCNRLRVKKAVYDNAENGEGSHELLQEALKIMQVSTSDYFQIVVQVVRALESKYYIVHTPSSRGRRTAKGQEITTHVMNFFLKGEDVDLVSSKKAS